MESKKDRAMSYCDTYTTIVDPQYYKNCEHNLEMLKNEHINYEDFWGCPQNYGIDEAEELCGKNPCIGFELCAKCWENALS